MRQRTRGTRTERREKPSAATPTARRQPQRPDETAEPGTTRARTEGHALPERTGRQGTNGTPDNGTTATPPGTSRGRDGHDSHPLQRRTDDRRHDSRAGQRDGRQDAQSHERPQARRQGSAPDRRDTPPRGRRRGREHERPSGEAGRRQGTRDARTERREQTQTPRAPATAQPEPAREAREPGTGPAARGRRGRNRSPSRGRARRRNPTTTSHEPHPLEEPPAHDTTTAEGEGGAGGREPRTGSPERDKDTPRRTEPGNEGPDETERARIRLPRALTSAPATTANRNAGQETLQAPRALKTIDTLSGQEPHLNGGSQEQRTATTGHETTDHKDHSFT